MKIISKNESKSKRQDHEEEFKTHEVKWGSECWWMLFEYLGIECNIKHVSHFKRDKPLVTSLFKLIKRSNNICITYISKCVIIVPYHLKNINNM